MLIDETEEVPSQAEVHGQLFGHFPIVIEISAVIIFAVVGEGDVRHANVFGAADIVDSPSDLGGDRSQKHLSNAGIALVLSRNIGVLAAESELAAGPRRLQGGELHMLPLEAHFETVFAVNFRDVVGELEG